MKNLYVIALFNSDGTFYNYLRTGRGYGTPASYDTIGSAKIVVGQKRKYYTRTTLKLKIIEFNSGKVLDV